MLPIADRLNLVFESIDGDLDDRLAVSMATITHTHTHTRARHARGFAVDVRVRGVCMCV